MAASKLSLKKQKNSDYKQFRTPRLYKEASKILEAVETKKVGLKNFVFNSKHRQKSVLTTLLCGILKHRSELEHVIAVTKLDTVPNVNTFLLRVIVYEHLFKNKLVNSNAKTALVVRENAETLEKTLAEYHADDSIKKPSPENEIHIPRYARVNLLKTTLDEAIIALESDNFVIIDYDPQISYENFLDLVKNLQSFEFICDLHIENLLIFHPKVVFYDYKLYKCGKLLLQDKSSLLPTIILNPPPGSVVMDACAAPGMKTTHLAAIMRNTGQILAMDLSAERSAVMEEILQGANVNNATIKVADFSTVNVSARPYSLVEYILLDPSCSGSGIVERAMMLDEDPTKMTSERDCRLGSLAKFQEVMLRKALSFPNVKRVVYSTCSIHKWENEQVVGRVLREFRSKFQIARPKLPVEGPFLNEEHDDFKELRGKCIRMVSKRDLTNGFFVATFERIVDDGAKTEDDVIIPEKVERKKELRYKKSMKSKKLNSSKEAEDGNHKESGVTMFERIVNDGAKMEDDVVIPEKVERKKEPKHKKNMKSKKLNSSKETEEGNHKESGVTTFERIVDDGTKPESNVTILETLTREKKRKHVSAESKKTNSSKMAEDENHMDSGVMTFECIVDDGVKPESNVAIPGKVERKKKRKHESAESKKLNSNKVAKDENHVDSGVTTFKRTVDDGANPENGFKNPEKVERKERLKHKKSAKSKRLNSIQETEDVNHGDSGIHEVQNENFPINEMGNAVKLHTSAGKSLKCQGSEKKKKRIAVDIEAENKFCNGDTVEDIGETRRKKKKNRRKSEKSMDCEPRSNKTNLEQDEFVSKEAVKHKKMEKGSNKRRKSNAETPQNNKKTSNDEVKCSPERQLGSDIDNLRSSKKKSRRKSVKDAKDETGI